MGRRKLPYKVPEIIRCKPTVRQALGDWYIEYYYMDPDKPGEYKPFKLRAGINYIKDIFEKEREAKLLRNDVEDWLKMGNSPFNVESDMVKQIEDVREEIRVDKEAKAVSNWTMAKAIASFNTFINGHGYTKRTIETYKIYVDDLEEWLVENDWLAKIASEITEYEIKVFLDDMRSSRDWSGRTYNNYFEFYGNFFYRCRKLEKIIHRGIKYEFHIENIDLKLTTPQVNKPYTPVLAKQIKNNFHY